MSGLAGFMAFLSAGLILSHFFPGLVAKMGLFYDVFFPITTLLTFTILAFSINNMQNKQAQSEYNGELERLRRELEITKKRVGAGQTEIKYPAGYINTEQKKAAN